MRIEAKYSGKDWLFIKKIQLKVIDGIDISFDLRRQSEVKSGTVLEWGDAHVSAKEAVELRKLIQSNKIYIRLWGKYSCDWEMTKEQRINFKEILDIYDYLVSESK